MMKSSVEYPRIPEPDRNFHCYRMGNLEIPATPIVGSPKNPFKLNEVDIKFRPQLIEDMPYYPQTLRENKEYLIERCKKRFGIEEFVDNTLIRLDDVMQDPENPSGNRGRLLLNLSLTTYSSLLATNASLDEKIIPKLALDSSVDSHLTLREVYGKVPYSDLSKSIFSNAPGVEVIVISRNASQTPENQMIIRRRSSKVNFYRGHYQASASGYMSIDDRDNRNQLSPFVTAIREAQEEIADRLVLSPEDFRLIGVALHWHGLYPAFFGYVETNLAAQELLGDFRRDSFEGYLFAIPFNPKDVLLHLATEPWTAMSALAAISSILAFFPRDKVESSAHQIPVKTAMDFLATVEG